MLNKQSQTLLDNFQASAQLKNPSDQGVTVSRTVSAAAVLYEAARNAVEFRAEHLIRRAAIERILRRRLIIKSTGSGIAEALIKELGRFSNMKPYLGYKKQNYLIEKEFEIEGLAFWVGMKKIK